MQKQIEQIREFNRAFGIETPTKPTGIVKDGIYEHVNFCNMRNYLLTEEVDELYEASCRCDIVGISDGIVDCLYILLGTAEAFGIGDKIADLFDEVHRSNMTKVPHDGKVLRRADGKILKPDTYEPPNLADILHV